MMIVARDLSSLVYLANHHGEADGIGRTLLSVRDF